MKDILSSIQNTISSQVPRLNEDLYRSAISSGWPSEVAAYLNVDFSDNKMSIKYPSRLKTEVENLEYGTETKRPNAVIRRFNNRLDSKLRGK